MSSPAASSYKARTVDLLTPMLSRLDETTRVLDFGAGDGWIAKELASRGVGAQIQCVDVVTRPESFADVLVYDGQRLPFDDGTFDLVYSVDVLHHCPDPAETLRDVLRCSRRYALIKDHTWRTRVGWAVLCVLDELGNRRLGIPSVYKYQRNWEWDRAFESSGFRLVERQYPFPCEPRLWGSLTNKLQFAALWERVS